MGLARKGTRTIHVDGRSYRWTVAPDSMVMWIVVERDGGGGQRMEASVGYVDIRADDGAGLRQRATVTPKAVSRAIAHALAEGWQPDERGLAPFRLDEADDKIWDPS